NLALTADPNGPTFEKMVSGIKKGIAVVALSPYTDQQVLNGTGYGAFREIVNGKLGRYITGAAMSFRTPNFWKGLATVGNPSTVETHGFQRWGGQPGQQTSNSVSAPALYFKELDIFDVQRRF